MKKRTRILLLVMFLPVLLCLTGCVQLVVPIGIAAAAIFAAGAAILGIFPGIWLLQNGKIVAVIVALILAVFLGKKLMS